MSTGVTRPIATAFPANADAVERLLAKPVSRFRGPEFPDVDADDSRSEWIWVRLVNGDMLLGFFPRGDAYMEAEADMEADYFAAHDWGFEDVLEAEYDE